MPSGKNAKISYSVAPHEKDLRLDVYLANKGEFASREEAKRAIKKGLVLVNASRRKPSYQLKPGDVITGTLPARFSEKEGIEPEPITLDIPYEDDFIVVVNKPAGLVVHPGAGNYTGTLVHALLYHCRTLAPQGAPLRPGIVHRLDKDTSGLLVVAKTAHSYQNLVDQFKEGLVEKNYLALVYGHLPEKSGTLETEIGRHPKDRKKMRVMQHGGKKAITLWEVREEYEEFSLLDIRIKTGRTHQIRAHLSYLAHPVVGDTTYGGRKRIKTIRDPGARSRLSKAKRHLLHAYLLSFLHPDTGERVFFTSPLPEDFEGFLHFLRKKNNR